MLPFPQKIAFSVFALLTIALGIRGFYRLYLRIRRGRPDPEARWNRLPHRLWRAFVAAITQRRTFKRRPVVGVFHAFIFYGFVFYCLVNLVDAAEGFIPFSVSSATAVGALYNALADAFSFLVLLGVIALAIRRFAGAGRRSFRFNERTMLHQDVQSAKITRDSLIVSVFILFHVGSRVLGAGAKLAVEGRDRFQPFASLLSHFFSPVGAEAWRAFGYWGALGSVLLFLSYFPYSKHVHLFLAPVKYLVNREIGAGVLPLVEVNPVDGDVVGAGSLADLGWPRLLDAYACIQCNRCQEVCPAAATGKALSPAALEINKRMELNGLGAFGLGVSPFEAGAESPRPLLAFALSPEAAWACTTCGACMEVCPVEDEQMLDIVDVRRHQVMIAGEFPGQLQAAFRGMERAQNPWGINRERRMEWAEGLKVRTVEENPAAEVLYWVGCAASYDPQAQRTARAFVELLEYAEVDFAVLGKRECCTGDSARRAGNEYLYRQLAERNVATLNEVRPKLIVASCPHCMNALGGEYRQIGGDYQVVHHTEFLERLVKEGRLASAPSAATIAFHDPCYLGRHNGVYDAPRNLLRVLGSEMVELDRRRENSFCCGAGGAQFWKEEEPGTERVSENRLREVQGALSAAAGEKVLAVGCPFCKSMLGSSPGKRDDLIIKDVAELLVEGVRRERGVAASAMDVAEPVVEAPRPSAPVQGVEVMSVSQAPAPSVSEEKPRKKWEPKKRVDG